MALTRTNKAGSSTTTAATTYTTASFSVQAFDLLVVFFNYSLISTNATPPTIGGTGTTLTGITWTQIATQTWTATNIERITAWYGVCTANSTGVLTFITPATAQGAIWSVTSYTGQTVTSPVSAAVIGTDTDAVAGPLDTSALTGTITVWGAARNTNTSGGTHSGATVIHDNFHAAPTRDMVTLEKTGENAPAVTWPSGLSWEAGLIAFKVQEAAATGVGKLVVSRVGLVAPDPVFPAERRPVFRVDGQVTGATGDFPVAGGTFTGGGTMWVWILGVGTSVPSPVPSITFPGATFTLVGSVAAAGNVRLSLFYSQDYTTSGSTQHLIISGGAVAHTKWQAHMTETPGLADPAPVGTALSNTGSGPPATLTVSAGAGSFYYLLWILDTISFTVPNNIVNVSEVADTVPMGSAASFWNPVLQNISQTSSGFGAGEAWALLGAPLRMEEPGFVHRGYGSSGSILTTHNGTIPYLRGGGVLWLSVATSNNATVTPTISGATFTLVETQMAVTGDNTLWLWYSQDYDAGTNIALTLTLASGAAMVWTADEQYPALTTGSPVIQKAKATWSTGSYTEARLAPGSGGVLYAVNYAQGSLGIVQGSGYELGDVNNSSPPLALGTYWDTVFRQDPHASGNVSSPLITFGLEVAVPEEAEAFPDVVVGGVKKTVVSEKVIVGGSKKTVANRWIVVGGVKRPLV